MDKFSTYANSLTETQKTKNQQKLENMEKCYNNMEGKYSTLCRQLTDAFKEMNVKIDTLKEENKILLQKINNLENKNQTQFNSNQPFPNGFKFSGQPLYNPNSTIDFDMKNMNF